MPQPVARNQQCLMIEADERRYFTHEEHLPQLLEFCKSFDMSMSLVKVEAAPLHDLSDLPKAMCDAKKTPKAVFSLVRKILPFDPAICIPLVRTRSQILETAKAVREKIRTRFSKGEAVSRDMLEDEFPDATITPATFMQHVRTARKELEEKGYKFERISPGCYRSITPDQQKVIEEEKKAITLKAPFWTNHKYTVTFDYGFAAPMYELGKKGPVNVTTAKPLPGDPNYVHAPIEPVVFPIEQAAPAAPDWMAPTAEEKALPADEIENALIEAAQNETAKLVKALQAMMNPEAEIDL